MRIRACGYRRQGQHQSLSGLCSLRAGWFITQLRRRSCAPEASVAVTSADGGPVLPRSLAERVDMLDPVRFAFRDHIKRTGTALVLDTDKVPHR